MTSLDEDQKIIHQGYLQTETDLDAIDQVLQWFEQFNREELGAELWMQAKIVLIEGFTNAVRHAHRDLPKSTPIELEATLLTHRLEIRIWDQGKAFDLKELLDTVEQRYPDPLEHDAHWGGTIMKKLTDKYCWKIHYFCPANSETERNCLWMQKQF